MTGNKLQRGEHKIFLLLLLFLGIIAVLFFYTAKKKINQTQNEVVSLNAPLNKKLSGKAVLADDAIVKIKIGEAEVMAEVVKSDAEKHTGLSGREKLDAGPGMFFVFTTQLSGCPEGRSEFRAGIERWIRQRKKY